MESVLASWLVGPVSRVDCRDDPDQQNLIDWIQEGWLECCGIDGPRVGSEISDLTSLTNYYCRTGT